MQARRAGTITPSCIAPPGLKAAGRFVRNPGLACLRQAAGLGYHCPGRSAASRSAALAADPLARPAAQFISFTASNGGSE